MIETTGADRDRELTALARPRGHLVDGLLYSPLGLGPEDVDQLRTPTPMVLLGERIFHGPVDHVMIDNVEGTKAVVRHLLDQGRRRIAVIGIRPGEKVGTAAIRYGAYADTLAEYGLPVPKDLAVSGGKWHRSSGADAMEELLASGREVRRRPRPERHARTRRGPGAHRARHSDPGRRRGGGLRQHRRGQLQQSDPDHGRSRAASTSPAPRSTCWSSEWPATTPSTPRSSRRTSCTPANPRSAPAEVLTVPEHPGIIPTPM